MTTLESRLAGYSSPVLSAFRIVFGLLFAMRGAQKLFDWPIASPMPIEVGAWPQWWAGLIEFVAGLLIAVGFFTRIAAFIASGEMAVAYFWYHWPPLEGESTSFWPIANGGEPAVMYCFAFLAIAGLGAGSLSVDARRRGTVGGAPGGRLSRRGFDRRGGDSVTEADRGRVRTDDRVPRRGLLDRFRR